MIPDHRNVQRIAINTGGGDAPGLNAVIRAATLAALNQGWEIYGIRDGYNGLLMPEQYPEGGLIRLTRDSVHGITHLGGTILGTTNRSNPLRFPILTPDGAVNEIDRSDELILDLSRAGDRCVDYYWGRWIDGDCTCAGKKRALGGWRAKNHR